MKDRDICEKWPTLEGFDESIPGDNMLSDKWPTEWFVLYPVTTKTVLYQALVYAGEHEIAKDVAEECKCLLLFL